MQVRVNANSLESFNSFVTSHAKNQLVELHVEINLEGSSIELSPAIRSIERAVEKAPCLKKLELDVFSSFSGVRELCLNSSSLRLLRLGDPEEAMLCDSRCSFFSIGDNVNCPKLTTLEMTVPHFGNPFDPFLMVEGCTFSTIEDLTLIIVPPARAEDEDDERSFAQKILDAIGQIPKLKRMHLHRRFDSLQNLTFTSAAVEKMTISESYPVSSSGYKVKGSSIISQS